MDQLKVFLRQCVKYRFWIAVGMAAIFVPTGYLVGSSAITEATTKEEVKIKAADSGIGKYTSATLPNPEYKRIVDERKEGLSRDVDATTRKLYARQEPLLKWPSVVQDKFRVWGRKWPENVDIGVVQRAINDYTIAYPDFIRDVYATFQPWNAQDGTGIVVAPDSAVLLKPAPFTFDNPPELGRVWAEQERLWVATALLDVVAKVNVEAKAKDWDSAWIKEIVALEVGTETAQDQKSMAKAVALEPAPVLTAPGAPAPVEAAPAPGVMPGGGAAGKTGEVYYLKSDSPLPYKVVPIQMTVRIEQNRVPEFLVALENSPMAVQVMEPEISKPTTPVIKPVVGETNPSSGGMSMGRMGMGRGGMSPGGPMPGGPMPGGGPGDPSGPMSRGGASFGRGAPSAAGGVAKKGAVDLRGQDKGAERKAARKAADKTGAATKKAVDQYFNVVELTVYGQARFYNTPPAPAESSAPTANEPPPAGDKPAPAPATAPVADPRESRR